MKTQSLRDFVALNGELVKKDLEVTIDGKDLKAEGREEVCTYYQLLDYTTFANGAHRVFRVDITSKEFFIILNESSRIEVVPESSLRLFVQPIVLKKIKAPHEHTETRMYCLKKGKRYYTRIEPVVMEYGPPQDDGTRLSSSRIFIKISDRPFKNSNPQRKESPAFEDYIYG